jgi:hypothetical protein
MILRKYAFKTKSAATRKINGLKEGAAIDVSQIKQPVSEVDGEIVVGSTYDVDVLWSEEPDSTWDSVMVFPLNPVHRMGAGEVWREYLETAKENV